MIDTLPPRQSQPDPRGWLAFTAPLPDDLQNAEDATQHHDFYGCFDWTSEWDDEACDWVDFFERPATDTERTLLTGLGYTLPEDLNTRVSFPSPLTRRRRWLQLEAEENTP